VRTFPLHAGFVPFVDTGVVARCRFAGVFQAVEIRSKGFPFSKKHEDFVDKYSCIVTERDGKKQDADGNSVDDRGAGEALNGTVKEKAEKILDYTFQKMQHKVKRLQEDGYRWGSSEVLYRGPWYVPHVPPFTYTPACLICAHCAAAPARQDVRHNVRSHRVPLTIAGTARSRRCTSPLPRVPPYASNCTHSLPAILRLRKMRTSCAIRYVQFFFTRVSSLHHFVARSRGFCVTYEIVDDGRIVVKRLQWTTHRLQTLRADESPIKDVCHT
jgi:hypothetical protein